MQTPDEHNRRESSKQEAQDGPLQRARRPSLPGHLAELLEQTFTYVVFARLAFALTTTTTRGDTVAVAAARRRARSRPELQARSRRCSGRVEGSSPSRPRRRRSVGRLSGWLAGWLGAWCVGGWVAGWPDSWGRGLVLCVCALPEAMLTPCMGGCAQPASATVMTALPSATGSSELVRRLVSCAHCPR